MLLTLQRQSALQKSIAFERKMTRERGRAIKEALSRLSSIPPNRWEDEVYIEEPNLLKLYQGLYLDTGVTVAKETINNFLSRKDVVDDDVYISAILEWTKSHLGERIALSNKTINKWLADLCRRVYEENRTEGIEKITRIMFKEVNKQWDSIKTWEIRRIAQTETMKSLNIARSKSIDALGVQYTKTWSVTGNNTRPSHLEVDRETIDQGELFLVGGYRMSEPMDETYGAPAGEIINCSCALIYHPKW